MTQSSIDALSVGLGICVEQTWRSYSNILEALQLQQDYYTWVLNEKRDITFTQPRR